MELLSLLYPLCTTAFFCFFLKVIILNVYLKPMFCTLSSVRSSLCSVHDMERGIFERCSLKCQVTLSVLRRMGTASQRCASASATSGNVSMCSESSVNVELVYIGSRQSHQSHC